MSYVDNECYICNKNYNLQNIDEKKMISVGEMICMVVIDH